MNEIVLAIRWYLAVQVFALAGLPLSLRLFRHLPDRGYGLSKALGLLLAGWVFWILNSFGWLQNTAGGVIVAVAAVLAAGLIVLLTKRAHRSGSGAAQFAGLRLPSIGAVIATEVVFGAAFVAWCLVRSRMPRIETAGGEKWMEIAFLRAILRSGAFPPHDPWLSAYAISYYYFGYLIMAMVTQLSGVPASIAFNLGIAALFALTCAGAYSLVYNLIALDCRSGGSTDGDALRSCRRWPLFGALLGPLIVAVMGNLEGLLEVLHARGIGPASLWRWLDIRSISEPPPAFAQGSWVPSRFFWWWQASRVVRDTAPWGDHWEVIDEFPAFSFILGDMHPHVLALPFVLLAIGLALALYIRVSRRGRLSRDPYGFWAGSPIAGWEALVYALCLGGLGFLNTWDFPIYLALASAAYGLARPRSDRWSRVRSHLGPTAAVFITLLVAGIVLYLPFWIGLQSQASGILPNLLNPTRVPQFLVMFGPLLVICVLFLALHARDHGVKLVRVAKWTLLAALTTVAVAGIGLLLAVTLMWLGVLAPEGPVAHLSAWLRGDPMPGLEAIGDTQILVVRRLLQRPIQSWPAVVLLATVVTAALTLAPGAERASSSIQDGGPPLATSSAKFALLLIGLGSLLALSVEFIYLRDVFGTRMNTVFKLYFQTWVLWAVAAAYALARFAGVARRVGGQGVFLGRVVRVSSLVVMCLLIAGGLVYTALAVPARAAEYGGRPTLDGASHLAARDADDYAAITWLNQNVSGAPVILEAPGTSYGYEGRISAHTGLPTVLGWSGHEYQWRGSFDQQADREHDIERIYATMEIDEALSLLDKYGIRYVIVGGLERSRYPVSGLSKFADILTPVFHSGSLTIYER